jgi:multidrug efflux pump subunit AcrB
MAFLSGVTGQFYKQFAVTIAISTVISAINSLTLSGAGGTAVKAPRRAERFPDPAYRPSVRLDFPSV